MTTIDVPYNLALYRPGTRATLLDDTPHEDALNLGEAENPAIHLAHYTGCQEGAPFVRSWCNIALDDHAQRAATSGVVDITQMCAACVDVIRSGGRCPACGMSVDDLIRRDRAQE